MNALVEDSKSLIDEALDAIEGPVGGFVSEAVDTAVEATSAAGEALATSAMVAAATSSSRWRSKGAMALLVLLVAGIGIGVIVRRRRQSDRAEAVKAKTDAERPKAGSAV